MNRRPDLLDTRRLRLLYELSLRGTLAEVAEALHQSPSSVSQALTQLEREVGVPLLEKAGRRVRLTAAAEILVEHTAVILERLELAASEVTRSAAGPRAPSVSPSSSRPPRRSCRRCSPSSPRVTHGCGSRCRSASPSRRSTRRGCASSIW